MTQNKHKAKIKLSWRLFGILAFILCLTSIFGSLVYYSKLIIDLSWAGIVFYSLIIIFIVSKLKELTNDSIRIISTGKLNNTKEGNYE